MAHTRAVRYWWNNTSIRYFKNIKVLLNTEVLQLDLYKKKHVTILRCDFEEVCPLLAITALLQLSQKAVSFSTATTKVNRTQQAEESEEEHTLTHQQVALLATYQGAAHQ